MNAPAGWYDDGQGRQRWWDGSQWTENYSGSAQAAQFSAATSVSGGHGVETTERPKPVLGYIGLGLAALGAVLAFFPITFAVALAVLFVAFVLSLIGLFKKNAPKWPSIVGMVLPPVAAALGFVVVLGTIAIGLSSSSEGNAIPIPESSANPELVGERPSPEEIAAGVEALAIEGGILGYEDQPEFFLCMGQFFYDSELSDESLRSAAAGEDILGSERELAIEVATDAALECDPLS